METREAFRQRIRCEQLVQAKLRVATMRLAEAERERIWAIVAAHGAGLSIRQIAAATGLSRSRIQQLLQDNAIREIPTRLSHLRGRVHDVTVSGQPYRLAHRRRYGTGWRRRSRCCAGASTGWSDESVASR